MSPDPDMQRILDALTAERVFVDGAMDLGEAGSDVALAAAIKLIDTIVLPRVLEFRVGDTALSLDIGGRRLRSLVSTEGQLPDLSAAQGHLLSSERSELVAALGAGMRSLILREGRLHVSRHPSQGSDGGAVDGGLSVNALAEAWEIDLDARPPTPIEQFCLTLGQDLKAMLVIKAGAEQTGLGDAALQGTLRALLAGQVAEFDPSFAVFTTADSRHMIFCQQGLLPGGLGLCFVKINEISILSAISVTGIAQIAPIWQSIHL